MNTHEKWLEKHRKVDLERTEKWNKWWSQDRERQKEMKGKIKYEVDMDGILYITILDKTKIKENDLLKVVNEYGEEFIQEVKRVKKGIYYESLELSWKKTTSPVKEETKNEYYVNGEVYYFENKPSKNQVFLIGNELLKVVDIVKDTKELTMKKEAVLIEAKALRVVYNITKVLKISKKFGKNGKKENFVTRIFNFSYSLLILAFPSFKTVKPPYKELLYPEKFYFHELEANIAVLNLKKEGKENYSR
jgi:hypothetical protein